MDSVVRISRFTTDDGNSLFLLIAIFITITRAGTPNITNKAFLLNFSSQRLISFH